jgi:serine/threonine-protein kinase
MPWLRRLLHAFLLAAVFAAVLLATTLISLQIISRKQAQPVPDLVGLQSAEALRLLGEGKFRLRLMGEEYHETMPPGAIVWQDPAPGTMLKPGRAIMIRLSKGPEGFRMPDLGGMSLRQARLTLEDAGLRPGREARMTSVRVAEGHIIAHSPGAGEPPPESGAVDLLISRGKPSTTVLMPNLVGLDRQRARDILFEAGHDRVQESSIETPYGPEEIVLDQHPPPGSPLREEAEVTLLLSKRKDILSR